MTFRRIFSWLIAAPVIGLMVVVAVANRDPVVFRLTPLPLEIEMPLYVALFASLLCGLLIGWSAASLARFSKRRKAKALAAEAPAV